MKKLLSLLSVLTISGTAIPSIIATSPYQKQEIKLEINENSFLQKNNTKNLKKINDINNTNYIIKDSKDNVYFGTSNGAFVLKQGETTPESINGISGNVKAIVVDSKDNVYFGTSNGAFVLKQGETTPELINGISGNVKAIVVDSKDNVYFGTSNGAFVLKQGYLTAEFVKGFNSASSSFPENYSDYLNQLTNITDNVNNILINKKDNDAMFITTNRGIYVTLKPYSFPSTVLSNTNNPKFNESFYFLSSDKKQNIYFSSFSKVYYLNIPEAKYEEIYGINGNINCMINNQDNLYIATNNGLYILKSGERTFEKINSINEKINNILIDKNNNIYFNSNNNIYLLSFSDNNISSTLIKKIDYINSDIFIKNFFIINDNIYITNYDGETYILYLKNDLKNINNLYLSDLIVNENKKYKDLTNTILESEIFKEFKLVDSNIKFIDMNGNDISDKQQNSGQFQIKIIANKNDFYWKGETKLITLSFIDEITFLIQENEQIKEETNKIKLDLDLMYKQIEQKKNLYNEMQDKIFKNYEKIIELQNRQIISFDNKDSLLLEIKQKLKNI